MIFSSLQFGVFCGTILVLYAVLPMQSRWLLLLLASMFFYAALGSGHLLIILAVVTLTSYFSGLALENVEGRKKTLRLWGGITTTLICLYLVKYVPFTFNSLNAVTLFLWGEVRLPVVETVISIGVSYYVFQAISYQVDIYFGQLKAERHLGLVALYLGFFPKLLQGPIERGADLLPQLKNLEAPRYENLRLGLLYFTWGLFQKVTLADRLGQYVDIVYGNINAFDGMALLLATYAYAFQIFFDFAGYTYMALGIGRLFNIELTQNFNRPYLATSVAEFWRRWHITFSRWILEYVFRPLQFSWRHGGKFGVAAALIVTFLVSGVWHGASWGFVVWGLLHGLFMAIAIFSQPYQKRLYARLGLSGTWAERCLKVFLTFHLICLAWVFFRAGEVSAGVELLGKFWASLMNGQFLPGGGAFVLIDPGGLLKVGVLCGCYLYFSALIDQLRIFKISTVFRWAHYYAMILLIVFFGMFDASSFIYFQF